MFIAADIVYSYASLHDGYRAGRPIDILWIVALALFALAATSQEAASPEASETVAATREAYEQRVAWLPFAALGIDGTTTQRPTEESSAATMCLECRQRDQNRQQP